jgi:hypothetical protein
MKLSREQLVRGSVLVGIGLIAALWLGRLHYRATAATVPVNPEQPRSWVQLGANPSVSLDGATYRVTGPYKHENLAIYLLHSADQDPVEYITLEEGLRSSIVKVTEKDQERVNELMIENTGDQPLFLQEGDRIQGGKQDRIIYASHVVPPHSGKMPVSSFCVEQGRWTAGAGGKNFAGNFNPVLAPVSVRQAAKVQNNQGYVWAAVAGQKALSQARGLSSNSNSSLNETLDAPKVKQLSDQFTTALKDVLEKQADAKGLAIALNGQIVEINEYPNHQVLSKLYPRLLGSYALEAVLHKEEAKGTRTPQAADVCAYMWDNDQQVKQVALAAAQPRTSGAAAGQARVFINAEDVAVNYNVTRINDDEQRAMPQLTGTAIYNGREVQRLGNARVPGRSQVQEATQRQVDVNKDNKLDIAPAKQAVLCTTNYQGKVVHRQFLPRDASQPAAQPAARPAPQPGQRMNAAPQRNNVQPVQNDVQLQREPQQVNPPAPAPKN